MSPFLKNIALWFLWFPLRFFIRRMPYRLSYFLAETGAAFFYHFVGGLRRGVIEELGGIFPEKTSGEIERIAKGSFKNYCKSQVENVLLGTLTKERIEEIVDIDGRENLDKALEKGKGAIILLAHFGSQMLVLPALGFKGYRIHQIVGMPKDRNSSSDRLVEVKKKDAENLPISFLVSNSSMVAAFRALKKNELIAVAFDGRVGQKWVEVEMFNRKSMILPGPVRIALGTGAALIPSFIIRNGDNTHRLVLEPPVELESLDADEEKGIVRNTQKCADVFEKYVRDYPCHFGMILQIMKEKARRGAIDKPLFVEKDA